MKQDLSRMFEHTKTENPYISPTAQNAETIKKETKKETNDFIKTALNFNEVDIAATRQKKKKKKRKLL